MGSARARETVRRLQRDITSGRWPVNSKIPNEAELAEELGVGRSTIREAVRSLAHLGMLEPAPGRGTFVRSLNPVSGLLAELTAQHSWEDLLAVRKALEVQAAELAAQAATEERLDQLADAHDADVEGRGGTERGVSPGQFHAVLVEISGNQLIADLYAGVMSALREGIRTGQVRSDQDAASRHAQHAALLAALRARSAPAAAAVAAAHADQDLHRTCIS
ncbi:MAG: GntR family transcriptional regulator [Nocardioidaceae bacterium]